MRKTLVFLLLALGYVLFSNAIYAQAKDDNDDDVEKPEIYFLKFSFSKFSLYDEDRSILKRKLDNNEVYELLKNNGGDIDMFNAYRTFKTIKIVTRGAGLILIVCGLTSAFIYNEDNANLIVAGTGLACVIAAWPLGSVAGNRARRVVDDFNYQMNKEKRKYSLNLGLTQHGIGLALNF